MYISMTSSPTIFLQVNVTSANIIAVGLVLGRHKDGWMDDDLLFSRLSLSTYHFCNIFKEFIWHRWEEDVPNSSFGVLQMPNWCLSSYLWHLKSNQLIWKSVVGFAWCSSDVCVPPFSILQREDIWFSIHEKFTGLLLNIVWNWTLLTIRI